MVQKKKKKKPVLGGPKSYYLLLFGLYDFVQISPTCSLRNVSRNSRLQMSASALTRKNFNVKFAEKKNVSEVYVVIADADIESLTSLHTFLNKYLYHIFELLSIKFKVF